MKSKGFINYLVDVIIGIGFLFSAVTGAAFLFMGSGGYQGGRNPHFAMELLGIARGTWDILHTWSSLIMIAGVFLHLVLHWNWIKCMTRNIFASNTVREKKAQVVCDVNA